MLQLANICFYLLQELKLNTLLVEEVEALSRLLFQLASDLRKDDYKDYYIRDFPQLVHYIAQPSQITEGMCIPI